MAYTKTIRSNIRSYETAKAKVSVQNKTITLTIGKFLSNQLGMENYFYFEVWYDTELRKIAVKFLKEETQDSYSIRGNDRPNQNYFTITSAARKLNVEPDHYYHVTPILGEDGLPEGFEVQF